MLIARGRIRSKHKLWMPGDEISGLSVSDEERLIRLGVAVREAPKKAPKEKTSEQKTEVEAEQELEKEPIDKKPQEVEEPDPEESGKSNKKKKPRSKGKKGTT